MATQFVRTDEEFITFGLDITATSIEESVSLSAAEVTWAEIIRMKGDVNDCLTFLELLEADYEERGIRVLPGTDSSLWASDGQLYALMMCRFPLSTNV